jgi:hypothetical protein
MEVFTQIVPHSRQITKAIVEDSNLIAMCAASVGALVNVIDLEVGEQHQILQEALDEFSIYGTQGFDPAQAVVHAVVRLLVALAEAVVDSEGVFRLHRENLLAAARRCQEASRVSTGCSGHHHRRTAWGVQRGRRRRQAAHLVGRPPHGWPARMA